MREENKRNKYGILVIESYTKVEVGGVPFDSEEMTNEIVSCFEQFFRRYGYGLDYSELKSNNQNIKQKRVPINGLSLCCSY